MTPYSRSQVLRVREAIERGLSSNVRLALSAKDINDLNRVIAVLKRSEAMAMENS